jgi:hypothetical protein
MLPITAHLARVATAERARSALPGAPVRDASDGDARSTASPRARPLVPTAALRRAADRPEPVAGGSTAVST